MRLKRRKLIGQSSGKELIKAECCNYQRQGPNNITDYCWCMEGRGDKCLYFGGGDTRCQHFEACVLPLAKEKRTEIEATFTGRRGEILVSIARSLGLDLNRGNAI